MKMLGIRLDERMIDRLKLKALRERTSVAELAREAFEDLLGKPRKESDGGHQ